MKIMKVGVNEVMIAWYWIFVNSMVFRTEVIFMKKMYEIV